jgi:quinol-cytochrome oxidoreductase complex cytochrome b subunit
VDGERAWRIATHIAGWVVGALLVVLIVTGIVLTFRYQPTVTGAYADVASLESSGPITARGVHRLASSLLLPAVITLAIASIGLFLVRRDRAPIVLPVLAAGFTIVAAFTGSLLPWDQLSLWAVTVGDDFRGYTRIIGGNEVKFVLLGSREVSPSTMSQWYWLHSVVLPALLAPTLGALVWRTRRRARPQEADLAG